MLTVALLHFEKLKNSTKRPDIFLQENLFQGEIKEDFCPTALEITFNFPDPTNVPEYNYGYVYPFKRFYFISSWVYVGGLWTANFVVDVLATYREEIKHQFVYALRSQSMVTPEIIDTTYMQKGGEVVSAIHEQPSSFWGNSLSAGTVVAGIIGSSGYNIGSVTYYAMSYSAFNRLMSDMLSSISWANISTSEISEELQKALINPTQYIVSCLWLPIALSDLSGVTTSHVNLGWWSFTLGQNAKMLNNPGQMILKRLSIALPVHPRYNEDGRLLYTRLTPFTRYSLRFLPFGIFDLDTSYFIDAKNIVISVKVSPFTGDAILEIAKSKTGNDVQSPILTTEANIGIPIPTGQIAANLSNYKESLTAGAVAGVQDLISSLKSR